jgi:photosystem II stability/assembly factor-like uncharacterized protein
MLTDAARLPDGRLALVGLSGTVLVSDAAGASWSLQQQEDRKGLSALLPLDGSRIVVVGEVGPRVVDTGGGSAR